MLMWLIHTGFPQSGFGPVRDEWVSLLTLCWGKLWENEQGNTLYECVSSVLISFLQTPGWFIVKLQPEVAPASVTDSTLNVQQLPFRPDDATHTSPRFLGGPKRIRKALNICTHASVHTVELSCYSNPSVCGLRRLVSAQVSWIRWNYVDPWARLSSLVKSVLFIYRASNRSLLRAGFI